MIPSAYLQQLQVTVQSNGTLAGYATLANFPPLHCDKCFRIVLSWKISAPELAMTLIACNLSCKVIPIGYNKSIMILLITRAWPSGIQISISYHQSLTWSW